MPDVRQILERNPDYWNKDKSGAQLPYLDRVEKSFYSGGDTSAAVAAFLSNQVDVLTSAGYFNTLNFADTDTIKRQMADKVYFIDSLGSSFPHLRLNANRPPFDNPKMRKAVNLAIDRQEIIQAITPGGSVPTGLVPPSLTGEGAYSVDELLKLPGYRQPKDQDIAEAKRLVKEAGFENVTVEMNTSSATPQTADFAALVKAHLGKVGINVNIKVTANYQDHLNDMIANKYQLTYTGHGASPDPDEYIYKHYHSKGARNYYKFSDPKWDELADKQRAAVTAEQRKKAVRDVLAYHQEIVPNVPIYSAMNQAVYRNYVHGFGKPVQPDDNTIQFDVYWMDQKR